MSISHFWTVHIEWKSASVKEERDDDREKRIFHVRIGGGLMHQDDAPFRIKATRNTELFSNRSVEFMKRALANKNSYSSHLVAEHAALWTCAFHGRSKRVTLYLLGCDVYHGLIKIDENLYALSPHDKPTSQQQQHRIELIPDAMSVMATLDDHQLAAAAAAAAASSSSSSSDTNGAAEWPRATRTTSMSALFPAHRQLRLALHVDARARRLDYDSLRSYLDHIVMRSHLLASYYLFRHGIRIEVANMTASASAEPNGIGGMRDFFKSALRRHQHHQHHLQQTASDLLNVYMVAFDHDDNAINNNNNNNNNFYDHYDGLAVRAALICGNSSNQQSANNSSSTLPLIAPVVVYNEITFPPVRSSLASIRAANVLIDLLATSLGKVKPPPPSTSSSTWHFQSDQMQRDDSAPLSVYECVSAECGNGRVEPGEQCDCARDDPLCHRDTCCDMSRCRVAGPHVTCTGGPCCDAHTCRPRHAGTECRRARSACDFAEHCDGSSAACPLEEPASYYHDGHACVDLGGETGRCWHGKCVRIGGQCRQMWPASSAVLADAECFRSFNTLGFESGHCGAHSANSSIAQRGGGGGGGGGGGESFVACAPRDAQCGLLHCQLGGDAPRLHTQAYVTSVAMRQGARFECQVITQPAVYVEEGSACAPDAMCVQRACVSVEHILTRPKNVLNKCFATHAHTTAYPGASNAQLIDPLPCSGNGVCDQKQTCRCSIGWSGPTCNISNLITTSKSNHLLHTPYSTSPSLASGSSSSSSVNTRSYSIASVDSLTLLATLGCASLLVLTIILVVFCFGRLRNKSMQTTSIASLSRGDEATKAAKRPPPPPPLSIKCMVTELPPSTNDGHLASLGYTSSANTSSSTSGGNGGCGDESTNELDLSLNTVTQAIQRLSTQPAKSILKKSAATMQPLVVASATPYTTREPVPRATSSGSIKLLHESTTATATTSSKTANAKRKHHRRRPKQAEASVSSIVYAAYALSTSSSLSSLRSSPTSPLSSSLSQLPASVSISSSLSKGETNNNNNNRSASGQRAASLSSLDLSNEEEDDNEDGAGEETVGLVADKQKEERIRTSKLKVQDYLNELESYTRFTGGHHITLDTAAAATNSKSQAKLAINNTIDANSTSRQATIAARQKVIPIRVQIAKPPQTNNNCSSHGACTSDEASSSGVCTSSIASNSMNDKAATSHLVRRS